MSLFCGFCHHISNIATRAINPIFQINHSLFQRSTFSSWTVLRKHSKLLRLENLSYENSSSVSVRVRNKYFTTSYICYNRRINEKEDDSLVLENKVSSSASKSLEESLTDEELKVLRELEEEERKLRETFSSEESDHNIWDGTFDITPSNKLAGSVSEGHIPFENQQRIIQDVIEEIWNPLPQQEAVEEELQYFPRGRTGVFDLGELVELLREENASEIVAISLPKEIDYADYMVIVTVSNNKHLLALATFVRKRFKLKEKKLSDVLPVLSRSINHKEWIALDLSNIILHIFLQETRDYYDLETLWTVGPLFDDLTNAKDPEIVQLLNTIK